MIKILEVRKIYIPLKNAVVVQWFVPWTSIATAYFIVPAVAGALAGLKRASIEANSVYISKETEQAMKEDETDG